MEKSSLAAWVVRGMTDLEFSGFLYGYRTAVLLFTNGETLEKATEEAADFKRELALAWRREKIERWATTEEQDEQGAG